MTDKMKTDALDAELKALNEAVEVATTARREWMDAHMADYAKFQIGDVLYDGETGRWAGQVAGYYRYHQGDPRYDTSMSIEYKIETSHNCFDNTSRQPYTRFVTALQMLDRRHYRANEELRWQQLAATPETIAVKDQQRELLAEAMKDYHRTMQMENARIVADDPA